jgi:hypothetical protein
MQNRTSSLSAGAGHALGGLVSAVVGGLFLAQAGGSDREVFLSVGFLLAAVGLLGIVIGGVALGIRLARDAA